MTVSNELIDRLRRYVAEPTWDTYIDDDLAKYIERYPIRDASGNEPTSTSWVANYDLMNAASEIWFEKAASVAADFRFTADGATFNRDQVYEQYMKMYRTYKARGSATSSRVIISPSPLADNAWIGNLSEENSGYCV